jgi:hypothetical protein
LKRVDQRSGDLRNVADSLVKGSLIGMGRLCKAADLSDKLKRGSFNLRVAGGWFEVK